jgi:hypothetical protein
VPASAFIATLKQFALHCNDTDELFKVSCGFSSPTPAEIFFCPNEMEAPAPIQQEKSAKTVCSG